MRTGRAGRGVPPDGGAGGAAHSARSTCPAKSPLRGTNETVPGAGVNSPGAAALLALRVAEIVEPLDDLGVAEGQPDAQRQWTGVDPRNHPDTFAGESGLDHQRQPAVVVAGHRGEREDRQHDRRRQQAGPSPAGQPRPARRVRRISSAWPFRRPLPAVRPSRRRAGRDVSSALSRSSGRCPEPQSRCSARQIVSTQWCPASMGSMSSSRSTVAEP